MAAWVLHIVLTLIDQSNCVCVLLFMIDLWILTVTIITTTTTTTLLLYHSCNYRQRNTFFFLSTRSSLLLAGEIFFPLIFDVASRLIFKLIDGKICETAVWNYVENKKNRWVILVDVKMVKKERAFTINIEDINTNVQSCSSVSSNLDGRQVRLTS